MVTSAERYIESLELFGMQFGLERMRALLDKLGHPERQFDAIHVVGSNGKSSTVRFAEALLEAEGIRILVPHLGQTPFLPARNALTLSLCPLGQRNLIPIFAALRFRPRSPCQPMHPLYSSFRIAHYSSGLNNRYNRTAIDQAP